jgi:transposase InsO family protein
VSTATTSGPRRRCCPSATALESLLRIGSAHPPLSDVADGDVLFGLLVLAVNRLVHHSDSAQYTSIRYSKRLAEADVPSIGTVGDSLDNAMAEPVIGLFKTELIRRRGPWRGPDAVEIATLEWVDWCNNRRLFEARGDIAPAEAEAT